MASIFDLKTNTNELSSSNEGTSKMEYDQHPPTRDITNGAFPNGAIHFRYQTSGQKWWIPSRSYMRMRCELQSWDGAAWVQVDNDDDVAPNMGLCANLFQSLEFRINDKTVSRIADFVPQVDALETRLSKSKSWLDSVGASTNWWQEDYKVRQQEVASDGNLVKPISGATVDEQKTTSREDLGFDVAGADNNNASYNASTGVITFSAGANASPLPADVRDVFPVGSYFRFLDGAGVGVPLKVITGENGADPGSPTTIAVEGLIVSNNGDNGQNDFERVDITPAGTEPSRRAGSFELCWQPPLSIFKLGHALPSGRYSLICNPQTQTSYQKRAIQSLTTDKVPYISGTPAVGMFRFNVVDMYWYCATVEGPRADDITYLLDLEQTRCQSEKISTTDFQQVNFDVSPSTYALTVAHQDLRAGNDTRLSSSIFKAYNPAVDSDEELKLDRFFINYAGQNLPAPDADPQFVAGKDYTTQRYNETQIYSGAYFDTGGAEDIKEFHNRGSYYYFSWPRKISHCVCCY